MTALFILAVATLTVPLIYAAFMFARRSAESVIHNRISLSPIVLCLSIDLA